MLETSPWSAEPDDGGARMRVGTTVCGWTIETALKPGPVCASWVGSRGGDRAVVRRLHDAFAGDDDARGHWLRASWAANRFHHARVVKVLEQGVDERGVPVVVRGWTPGETLEEAVRRGVLAPISALRLIERLLDVLEIAHAHGIVHGALSPSNVIVTPRGSVRVVDFATTPGLHGGGAREAHILAAARLGPFTAPERRPAPAVSPSEQGDVWGVGACLHYAIAGQPPGAQPLLELPTPHRTVEPVSDDVAAVVSAALGDDPLERYESAYAMLGDIRRLLTGRKPKLRDALAPVPSQSLAPCAVLPPSSSGMRGARGELAERGPSTERWGNVLLVIAIALLVALATFVMMRERLGEAPAPAPASQASP